MNISYEKTVSELLAIPRFTTKNDLQNITSFLVDLKNPEKDLQVIHIAGTNGKGSVCLYLESMLSSKGFKVGKFTSPHLIQMTERIQVNQQEISQEVFCSSYLRVKSIVKKRLKQGLPYPTFFEILFYMAMLIFQQEKVDYVVLETGLGGRLDATNSIPHPILTGITNIGMDHTEILGDTIKKIAAEKAGIIKPGVPVFYMDSGLDSNQVIVQKAKEQNSPCFEVTQQDSIIKLHNFEKIVFLTKHQNQGAKQQLDKDVEKQEKKEAHDVSQKSSYSTYEWVIPSFGIFQAYNASMAIRMMEFLFSDTDAIPRYQKALETTKNSGRLEEIRPLFYVDGAHNPEAILGFVESLKSAEQQDEPKPILLFACSSEKNEKVMIQTLTKHDLFSEIIITQFSHERSKKSEELVTIFTTFTTIPITSFKDTKKAIDYALNTQGKRRVFCIGSLYLVGEVRSYLC